MDERAPVGDERRHDGTAPRLLNELRRSETQYRSTIDAMTDALHVVDRDLRILLINRAFLEWHGVLGLTVDVLGKRLGEVYDFLPPEVEQEYKQVFDTGRTLTTEETTRVGGEDIITETRKIPIVEEENVVKVVTIIRDITERKKMELALRRSEAKFRSLAERSPNMIFINRMGRILYVNRKCTEIMGYTKEEFYSPDFDFLCVSAPESIEDMVKGYSAYLEGAKQHSHELTLAAKSGARIDCIVAWIAVDYEDGTAMLGVVTDITARKRVENALRASEEKYRSFVEHFHGIAYRGDCDGTPLFFHGDVERITGYTEDDLLNGTPSWAGIILAEDRFGLQSGLSSHVLPEGDEVAEREYRIKRKDGQIRWVHQSLKPVRDTSGAIIYVQGALYDVTERKVAQDTVVRERNAFGLIVDAAVNGLDIGQVCGKVLGGLVSILGFDCGTVRLYDPGSGMLRVVRTHGFTSTEVERYIGDQHIDDAGFIAAYVGRTQQPLWAPDLLRRDDLKEFRQRCSLVGVKSMISWPLVSANGGLLGVMHLLARRPVDIPQEDRVFFQTVSELFTLVLERKRAEEAVEKSEARYRTRFENSPIALWEEDFSSAKRRLDNLHASGVQDIGAYLLEHPDEVFECAKEIKILGANRAAMELYHIETLKDFARVYASNVQSRTMDAFRRGLTMVAQGKTEFDLDYETRTAKGNDRFVRLRWCAAPGCEKTLERVLVSVVDLTERKEAEEVARRAELQLRRYSEELEDMVKDRTERIKELERQRTESEKLAATGRMAARIAHEINNPLAGIKNSFLLLRKIMDEEHPHYKYAARVQKEIDRIAQIIRKMFDLYSPDPKKKVKVCINEAIRDVLGIMESTFRAAGIEVVVDIPETLIEIALPVGYFDQVLFNLVQNAVEASSAGDIITIGAIIRRDSVVVSVSDQGVGVQEKLRNRIFEPFYTTKGETGGKGLGLGLAVSKGMVEAMGGTITVEDNSPGGTVFTVALPRRVQVKED